jgi:hypothetical protein
VACAPQEPEEAGEQADAYGTQEQPTPEVSEEEVPGTEEPSDLGPLEAESRVDAVAVGRAVAEDGSISPTQEADEFAAGEPVMVAMEVEDVPAGSAIEVVWLGPDDERVGEQLKTVEDGQAYLSFETPDTTGWAEGRYKAEVWIGDEKVATERFQIVAAGEEEEADGGMGG